MADLAFEGVGRLNALNMGASSTLGNDDGGDWFVDALNPLTSKDVQVWGASQITTDTIASVKSSYDMPTETLSRLGGTILGNTAAVGDDNKQFSKPPFKASFTADGQDMDAVASAWTGNASLRLVGTLAGKTCTVAIESSGLNVSTKSFSQNVGDVGATFSVTAEGTKMTFTSA